MTRVISIDAVKQNSEIAPTIYVYVTASDEQTWISLSVSMLALTS